jgi:hypothetical protein
VLQPFTKGVATNHLKAQSGSLLSLSAADISIHRAAESTYSRKPKGMKKGRGVTVASAPSSCSVLYLGNDLPDAPLVTFVDGIELVVIFVLEVPSVLEFPSIVE